MLSAWISSIITGGAERENAYRNTSNNGCSSSRERTSTVMWMHGYLVARSKQQERLNSRHFWLIPGDDSREPLNSLLCPIKHTWTRCIKRIVEDFWWIFRLKYFKIHFQRVCSHCSRVSLLEKIKLSRSESDNTDRDWQWETTGLMHGEWRDRCSGGASDEESRGKGRQLATFDTDDQTVTVLAKLKV